VPIWQAQRTRERCFELRSHRRCQNNVAVASQYQNSCQLNNKYDCQVHWHRCLEIQSSKFNVGKSVAIVLLRRK
jgi:hypothetical protein